MEKEILKILKKNFKISPSEIREIKNLREYYFYKFKNFDSFSFVDFITQIEKKFKIDFDSKLINKNLTVKLLTKIIIKIKSK